MRAFLFLFILPKWKDLGKHYYLFKFFKENFYKLKLNLKFLKYNYILKEYLYYDYFFYKLQKFYQ